MDGKEVVTYLKSLDKFGMMPGLARINALLDELSHPELFMDVIHVAGTNGKGSTAAMIESILRKSGYKTGLFSSPHLVRYSERIKVCGEEIPLLELDRIRMRLNARIEEMRNTPDVGHPTEFELTTAICFEWFRVCGVEVAVIEAGLGGLLDSTNVVIPKVSVITPIGFDHMEVLGENLQDIAYQKAGIIKRGVPLATSKQLDEAYEVLEKEALIKEADIYRATKDIVYEVCDSSLFGVTVDMKIDEDSKLVKDCSVKTSGKFRIELGLSGIYQAENAACALLAVSILRLDEKYSNISDEAICSGFKSVSHSGRFEVIGSVPTIILDGAHNLEGARALSDSLRSIFGEEKLVMLMGLSKDKPASKMLKALKENISYLFVTHSNHSRLGVFDTKELAKIAALEGIQVEECDDMEEALRKAKEACEGKTLVVCGSLYLIGEIKSILTGER